MSQENSPLLHLIGMAKRAGKLEIGEEPVGAVARAKQAKLIVLASDASPNTLRRAATFGQAGNVLQLTIPHNKAQLGAVLGRSSVAMLAFTDAGFAGALGDKLLALDPEKYAAAATQLRQKADRTLARQKEKRQHEKNLKKGKGKPWAPPANASPPAKKGANPSPPRRKHPKSPGQTEDPSSRKPFPRTAGKRMIITHKSKGSASAQPKKRGG